MLEVYVLSQHGQQKICSFLLNLPFVGANISIFEKYNQDLMFDLQHHEAVALRGYSTFLCKENK